MNSAGFSSKQPEHQCIIPVPMSIQVTCQVGSPLLLLLLLQWVIWVTGHFQSNAIPKPQALNRKPSRPSSKLTKPRARKASQAKGILSLGFGVYTNCIGFRSGVLTEFPFQLLAYTILYLSELETLLFGV